MTLEVSGDVNISGSLWVDDNNMTVPDYVFEAFFEKETFMKENKNTILAGYQLMSISELAEYIKANKQLPASKIQGQFALDGESNNLVRQQYYLLEKIEEQAIYIIQLNDALTFLQEENRAQKKQLEEIKKAITVSAQEQQQIIQAQEAMSPSPAKSSQTASSAQIPQKS